MSRISRKFFLILTLTTAFGQKQKEPSSTVTILAVDVFGRAIPALMESFTLKGNPLEFEFRSHFAGLKGTAIPFGKYEFVLRRVESKEPPGKIWGRVSVDVPEKTTIVVAERNSSTPSESYPPFSTTLFRLAPLPDPHGTQEPLRVRLSGLVGQDQEDAVVDPSGDFRIHGWLRGPFILTVLRGDQIIHIEPIVFHDMSRSETILIKLPSALPTVLHVRPPW
jgi:hypothetical protein